MSDMSRFYERSRWLYELSFSAYAALLVVTEEGYKSGGSVFLGELSYIVLPICRTVARLTRRPASPLGLHPGIYLLWALLALIALISVHTVGRFPLLRKILSHAAGVVTVAGFPVIWLRLGTMIHLSASTARWLQIEIVGIIACLVLYLIRDSPWRLTLGLLALALHFGLWGWFTRDAIATGFWWTYLLLGVSSGMAWGVHVKALRG
jgi:uncharacterized membrane protein